MVVRQTLLIFLLWSFSLVIIHLNLHSLFIVVYTLVRHTPLTQEHLQSDQEEICEGEGEGGEKGGKVKKYFQFIGKHSFFENDVVRVRN